MWPSDAGGDVEAAQVVASGRADFGVDTLPALLMTRDDGTDIVSIAQVFSRSGTVVEDAAAGMPADGVFAAGEWLAKPENRDLAVRFLQASFLGWVFCRDYPDECVRILHDRVAGAGGVAPALAAERDQRADLAERDRHRHDGSVRHSSARRSLAQRLGLIERPATGKAWRDDLALLAVTEGQDEEDARTAQHYDLLGTYWEKPEVGADAG